MPINVNDITFVDISELAEVEQIDGSEEIQVSESHKINLKNLISNFLTTQEFAQALTQYYTKAQTYTKTEVHTLLSSLNAGVDLKLASYIRDTELTTTLQNYITSTVYNNFVNQINTELSKKVTSVMGYRLLGNNELDAYSIKATKDLPLYMEDPEISNYVLKVTNDLDSTEYKMPLNSFMGIIATHEIIDSTSKEIIHDYGDEFYPSIMMVDTEGNEVNVAVKYLTGGRILVSWNEAKSGKIILKR